ncbi:MAG: hypothetical protein ACRC14_00050 [Paracoccaceae bacterium]
MADANLADFYGRIARIERAHAKGYGFEANGTLGRSHYLRPVRQRRPLLRALIFALVCAFGLKGAILYNVGPESYEARVERLQTGKDFDQLGAWLMQADPVTVWVASQIDAVATKLRS